MFLLLVVASAFAGGFVESRFTDFRFSPDGAYLAGAAVGEDSEDEREATAMVWEVSSGELVMEHHQDVAGIQFHPTLPQLRVTHTFYRRKTPVDDFTFDLETGERSDVGAFPFVGWTDTPGEVYVYTDYQHIDDDTFADSLVSRVPLRDAIGAPGVVLGTVWGTTDWNELHLTVEQSWAQEFPYLVRWLEQSAATGEFWLTSQEGLFRLGPSLEVAERVSAPPKLSVAMGVDGRLIIVDHRVVVDAVTGAKHKLPKKVLLSDTVLPGSESVLMLNAAKDRFQVLSPAGELLREFPLQRPLEEDCYAGPTNGLYTFSPCSWHEPSQRLALDTPDGIRIIDTTTGADVGLLDTGVDVRTVWAERRRIREIEEEEEHRQAVQHREEVRIAVEARQQAEHEYANRPTHTLHLRVNMGLMEATYDCASVYVDVPVEMSDEEAMQEVRSRLYDAGIRVLSFEEIPPGGEARCRESFSSMDLR